MYRETDFLGLELRRGLAACGRNVYRLDRYLNSAQPDTAPPFIDELFE